MASVRVNRLAPLEWVRAGATLLVVLLHALMPYVSQPMPGVAWPVWETGSTTANAVFWAIELFIMPLFLVLAGFVAVGLIGRLGKADFLRHRARRLLVPLLFGLVVVLPIDLYVWLLGWVVEGKVGWQKMRSLKIDPEIAKNLWGTSHLWFLQYLLLYSVLYAVVKEAWPERWRHPVNRRTVRAASLLALIAIGGSVLLVRPEVVFGFQHGFFPVASKWIYNGTFYAGGIWLAVFDSRLRRIERNGVGVLLFGLLGGIASLWAGMQFLQGDASRLILVLGAVATLASAWALTFGIIGAAVRFAQRPRRIVLYVAAASFWIYLAHHPFLGLVHIGLKVQFPDAAPLGKGMLAWAIATLWCLGTYQIFVRHTFIGRMLGVRHAERVCKQSVAKELANLRQAA
ncbi:glucans biosynthesis protein [Roseimaritima multifibrata]|uniref:Glucans biosynthesis protein n=1 Tax=Roseimaritima multifibrata TaxID=1930274 RepID=A0A517MBK0_9BACT|nr:acyltransferase [Roseimaritima multifibrata]QDS92260.1 glucans biosynthesis protein [Roseimaritima multifibrata]